MTAKFKRFAASALALTATAGAFAFDMGFTGADSLLRRDTPRPVSTLRDTTISLWRGERAGLAGVFASPKPTGRLRVRIASDDDMVREAVKPQFLDYVITGPHQGCGWPDDTAPAFEVADALTTDASAPIAAGTRRPFWITADIPADAAPGPHSGWIVIDDTWKDNTPLDSIHFTIDVSQRTLPDPTQWQFNINMWQQPYAIARYYGLDIWSPEHFAAMEPYVDLLARSGQKTISAILFYEPWGDQSNDKFPAMIATTRRADGSWSYDYTDFDRWVEFMMAHGIDDEIECFSMIPWDMNFTYFDEAKGAPETLHTTTDSKEYADLWSAYLKAFQQHLKEKGWLDRTYIAIDERSLDDMLRARELVKANAPGIKLALHGNYHPELDDLDSYTLLVGTLFPDDVLAKRNAEGKISRYYTCCANVEPNIFSNSQPADAAYIPVYCLANNVSGYLHWAFFNWTDNPLTDTRFFMFAPGDTYCVYPGGSSLRWERMIEGVELAEKIAILQRELTAAGNKAALAELDAALAPLRGAESPFADRVRHYDNLRDTVGRLAR